MCTDDGGIRRVKALDEAKRLLSLAREGTTAGLTRQEIAERFVWLVDIDVAQQAVQVAEKVATLTQAAVVCVPMFAVDVYGLQLRRARNCHRFFGAPVQELRTQLDGQGRARIAQRIDAAANALSRLEYHELEPGPVQLVGCGQAGHARADDDGVQRHGARPRASRAPQSSRSGCRG